MAKLKRPAMADAVQIICRRYCEGRAECVKGFGRSAGNDSVARKLTALCLRAGVTQREFAHLVGTTTSAMCRLENTAYDWHSLRC